MTTHAPQIPKVEVKYSAQGVVDLVHMLSESGDLDRQSFKSIADGLILNWRFSKTKPAKKADKPTKGEKGDKAMPKSSAPKVQSKKDADKVSGLLKLAAFAGVQMNITEYSEYLAAAEDKRKSLEAQWAQKIGESQAEKIADKIGEFLKSAGLNETEIKASRAYFPKLQGGKAAKETEESPAKGGGKAALDAKAKKQGNETGGA